MCSACGTLGSTLLVALMEWDNTATFTALLVASVVTVLLTVALLLSRLSTEPDEDLLGYMMFVDTVARRLRTLI